MTRIAWIGVGLMGRPMVRRLAEHSSHELIIWNRTHSRCEGLGAHVAVASSPEEAVDGADIVFSMLESGPVVEQVIFQTEVLDSFRQHSVFIDMASIPPETAQQHYRQLKARNVEVLDAPVSGGTVGAEAGSLAIMVGGSRPAFDQLFEILSILGSPHYMGGPGMGQYAKLANQAIVGITIGAVSEAFRLAKTAGVNLSNLREALLGGFAQSRILEAHGARMISGNYQPGAPSRIQLKDMDAIIQIGESLEIPLPLSRQMQNLYGEMVGAGWSEADHSAVFAYLEGQSPPAEKE